MREKRFDEDIVQASLQAILGRKVSYDEARKFIKSEDAQEYMMDYDDMMTSIWENYHCENSLVDFVPLELLLFRHPINVCITPKAQIKDCLWLDIVNGQYFQEEFEEILKNE